jgi:hypothetical protein
LPEPICYFFFPSITTSREAGNPTLCTHVLGLSRQSSVPEPTDFQRWLEVLMAQWMRGLWAIVNTSKSLAGLLHLPSLIKVPCFFVSVW